MNTNDGRPAPLELRAFIDGMPALAWSCRPNGYPELVNQRFLQYSGLSQDQIYGEWKSTLHPDDVEVFENWWQGLQEPPKLGQTEVRVRRVDGEYRWFQISAAPVRDEQGNLLRWCGVNTDIDDRKRAEEALRASETSFRVIVDSIPGLVCTMSATGDVQYINQQVLEYFGKTPEELKNWVVSDAVHPDDLARVLAAFTRSIETGQPYDSEQRCRRADGVYRWFQVRALPVRNAESPNSIAPCRCSLRLSREVIVRTEGACLQGYRIGGPATGFSWRTT